MIGRLRKPHGLKGDSAIFPLTDVPEQLYAPGRPVWVMDLNGSIVAGPLTIERSRAYHREWLIAFRDHGSREAIEPYGGMFLSVPERLTPPPAGDEVYLHELEGFAVADLQGTPLGVVSGVLEMPAGLTLEVQGPKREFLMPYRKEFVRKVDREARRLVVELPEGLMDL